MEEQRKAADAEAKRSGLDPPATVRVVRYIGACPSACFEWLLTSFFDDHEHSKQQQVCEVDSQEVCQAQRSTQQDQQRASTAATDGGGGSGNDGEGEGEGGAGGDGDGDGGGANGDAIAAVAAHAQRKLPIHVAAENGAPMKVLRAMLDVDAAQADIMLPSTGEIPFAIAERRHAPADTLNMLAARGPAWTLDYLSVRLIGACFFRCGQCLL